MAAESEGSTSAGGIEATLPRAATPLVMMLRSTATAGSAMEGGERYKRA
jgi:hypothetical protein